MTIVAIISVRAGKIDVFREYEHRAVAIMARYGGAIERTVVIDEGGADLIREVHIVTFPDGASFDAYRADAELQELTDVRAEAVMETQLMIGHDGPAYGVAKD